MRNFPLIAKITALTAILGAASFSLTLNAQSSQPAATECTGWASEISEVSGALFDQIDPNRSKVTNALYELEILAEETCETGGTFAYETVKGISKVSKILETEILNDKNSTDPQRVLARVLLKLIQDGMPMSLSMTR